MAKKYIPKAKRKTGASQKPEVPADRIVAGFIKKYRILEITYTIIGVILLIVLFPKTKEEIIETYQTPRQKYIKENFPRGIFLPEAMDTSKKITIQYGSVGVSYSVKTLKEGASFSPNAFGCGKLPPFRLRVKVIKDRLYISTRFIDLQNQFVGAVDFKQWTLFKPNLLVWHDSDTKLEVLDRSGLVILKLEYTAPGIISLEGYDVGPECITVATPYGVEFFQTAQQALPAINRIQSTTY